MRTIIKDISPTNTAGAYSAGDVIGGKFTIDVGAIENGVLESLVLIDDDAIDADMKIYLFSSDVATIADNAAFSLGVADLKKIIGRVAVAAADYTTIGADSVVIKRLTTTETVPYASLDGIIYAYAVLDGIETYTSTTALTFRFIFLAQDV